MDVYIIKFSICLALFVLFYKLLLENQNMHRFKRYYLLLALVFAFSVPFITFTEYVEPVQPSENFQTGFEPMFESQIAEVPQVVNYLPIILWSIYGLGVLLFSAKFILNLAHIFNKIRKNETHKSQSFIYVLLNDLVIPHSFFSYIFLNKQLYKTEQIPREVLIHEQTHAKQKHSIDILVIELLQIVFWFHPLIYILKHAVKLNHEFLADQAVINQGVEPSAYQQLLIAFSSPDSYRDAQKNQLASAINYSSIKKRFTVMKTHTSKRNIWLRSLILLPLIAFSIYGFSNKKEVIKNTQTAVINQDSIPVLIIEQNPLKLTLNGKPTSLELLHNDFKEATSGKVSDLEIKTNDALNLSLIESIGEALKPNLAKVYFKSKLGIIHDRLPAPSEKSIINGPNKPLLQLIDNVNVDCGNCILDKELLKDVKIVSANNNPVESFKIKFYSKPTISINGNTLNAEATTYLELMKNDESFLIFDIMTKNESLEGNINVTVKTEKNNKVHVVKGGSWDDVKTYLSQDKKVIKDINIYIDKNENLFLNNNPVTLKNLADKVNELNKHLSVEDKRKYLQASIISENEAQFSIAYQITTILHESCNVFQTSSSNSEAQKKLNLAKVKTNLYAGKSTEEAKEMYENEMLDFSVKEKPADSSWKIKVEVNDITFIETNEEPAKVEITEKDIQEYNAIAKRFNAMPKDKRIIKKRDFERLNEIYFRLSDEQKKKAEPYPKLFE